MSSALPGAPRSLPESPDLRHLKQQAKDLLKAGSAESLTEAQFKVARSYGFTSWPKLKAHVDSSKQQGQLKEAIDRDDVETVCQLMTQYPSLHKAPLGYGESGPLTWAAECRALQGSVSDARLTIAEWMIQHGSDVHQGGDAPLMRASLRGTRTPMMALLVARGADVNAKWNGSFPILFAPCETVDAAAITWLLRHGSDPNIRGSQGETALDYLLGSYVRSDELCKCVDALASAGGQTQYGLPGVLEVVTGQSDQLNLLLEKSPELAHRSYPELNFGATGARRMVLRGATLLHVAAEFGNRKAVELLIASGADVNARATVNDQGIGGQTAIYHSVTQFRDYGFSVTEVLLEAGANLNMRAKLPGSYEIEDEVVECTPLEYAQRFPGSAFPNSNGKTLRLLINWTR